MGCLSSRQNSRGCCVGLHYVGLCPSGDLVCSLQRVLAICSGLTARTGGQLRTVACVFVSAAFVSSGAEFAISDSTGIGASGVVYAIFGFMWMTRSHYPSFQKVVDVHTARWFIL